MSIGDILESLKWDFHVDSDNKQKVKKISLELKELKTSASDWRQTEKLS